MKEKIKAKYVCPTCGEEMPREYRIMIHHSENHIMEIIRKQHPGRVRSYGTCKRCYEEFKKQLHPD